MFDDTGGDSDNPPVANDPPTDVGGIIGPGGQNIGRPGRSPEVREVDTEEEIEAIYGLLSKGGTRIEGGTYPGDQVRHPDGTLVGRRPESTSGGPTIDIHLPDGTLIKVHLP